MRSVVLRKNEPVLSEEIKEEANLWNETDLPQNILHLNIHQKIRDITS